MTHHLNELDFSLPKDTLCQVWFKLAMWFLRIFKSCQMNVFSLYDLLFKKCMALHSFEPLYPRIHLCAKLSKNWTSGSRGDDFKKLYLYFYLYFKAKENHITPGATRYLVSIFKKCDKFLAFYSAYFRTRHQNTKYLLI